MFRIDPASPTPKQRQVSDELARMVIGESREFQVGGLLFAVLDRECYVFGEKGRYVTATIRVDGKPAKRVTRTD